jgi:hypothetical protein
MGSGESFIHEATVECAVRLVRDYLVGHAKLAFGLMGADPRLKSATRVVEWLRRRFSGNGPQSPAVVSTKEVHTGVFGGGTKAEEVESIMELLARLGYLRHHDISQQKHGPGRRPGSRFEVNPIALVGSGG